MKRFSEFVCKHRLLIVIASFFVAHPGSFRLPGDQGEL